MGKAKDEVDRQSDSPGVRQWCQDMGSWSQSRGPLRDCFLDYELGSAEYSEAGGKLQPLLKWKEGKEGRVLTPPS